MNVKKKTIEEKMSQSIFYNLSILKQAVKTTVEFEENLSCVRKAILNIEENENNL